MLTPGDTHKDTRGVIRFVNDFNMSKVVRMYCIAPKKDLIRAWQGHKEETKWFFVAKGSFLVKLVSMKDRNFVKQYELSDKESQVLEIPGGYFNGFKALTEGSVLMVYSNFDLDSSIKDDYRESLNNINW